MDLHAWLGAELDSHRFAYQLTALALPMDQWGVRPHPGANPVAWLVWHTARWHDLAINTLVRDEPTVWEGGWSDRLGIGGAPGTGFDDSDVDALAAAVDREALNAYWHAVYDHSSAWLSSTSSRDLAALMDEEIDTDDRYAQGPSDLLPPAADWVQDFHRGHRAEFFVRWVAIGHNYWHLGELNTITTALGVAAG